MSVAARHRSTEMVDSHHNRRNGSDFPLLSDRRDRDFGLSVHGGSPIGKWASWVFPTFSIAALFWLAMPGLSSAVEAGRPVISTAPRAAGVALLSTSGRHFVDPTGGVVILRGVNLSGNSKVPPFLPGVGYDEFDRLRGLGMNVARLLFIWEAYEPSPGVYDESYLEAIRATAAAAWTRGIYTIVDVHQDGFSRYASRGSGDGFPPWAVSGRLSKPDNGPGSKYWPILMATDPSTHRSFRDFFANATGARTRYLLMLGRVAGAFGATPGVIGYDPINEPWGDERRDLGPLYRDAAAVIRARHPAAILFLEGHVTTNRGIQTKLDRPEFGNIAYSPHYYKPSTIALQRWNGSTRAIDRAFAAMGSKAEEWDVPLFLGEFGAGATVQGAGDYVGTLVDRLDALLASGAQWNYTPLWNERDKDGWNVEDFNILDPGGQPRPNFRPRPHPRRVAGIPLRFSCESDRCSPAGLSFEFAWHHRPELGNTEIFVPNALFPPGVGELAVSAGVTCWRDTEKQVLVCRRENPGVILVRLTVRE